MWQTYAQTDMANLADWQALEIRSQAVLEPVLDLVLRVKKQRLMVKAKALDRLILERTWSGEPTSYLLELQHRVLQKLSQH